VHWADDRRELKLLAQRTGIPLSAGESELTSYGCRALLEERGVEILQFDCTMMGGFTEARKLSALCELNDVQVAPHHDCFIHAHIVAATPAGCIVESFTDPECDPLQAELFEDPPPIANGILKLKEQPGLGLTLSESPPSGSSARRYSIPGTRAYGPWRYHVQRPLRAEDGCKTYDEWRSGCARRNQQQQKWRSESAPNNITNTK
jgi:hypothetical protein